jgi:hypothetical protein
MLAATLEERRDFFLWPGHRRNDARAVLERVVMLIARDRAHASGAKHDRLDRLHRALHAALDQLPAPVWNADTQRYNVDEGASQIVAGLNAHRDTRPYVVAAQEWLRQEYDEWQQHGQQLGKELAEGTSLPLETKLRGLVRSMKKRGDLPAGTPMQNDWYMTVAAARR